MTAIPICASADELPAAIEFAQKHTTARWFIHARAQALGQLDLIPAEWGIQAATALKMPHISEAEKRTIQTDVAGHKEDELPADIIDPDHDGDDDLTAEGDTDHDGEEYRKRLGLTSAIDYNVLVASGFYDDFGIEDAYDEYDLDSELPAETVIAAAFTAEQRQTYAKQDIALPDGSFPIPSKRYLKKAIRAVGRSKHSADTVRQHIVKRAKALGATSLLPESYAPLLAASGLLNWVHGDQHAAHDFDEALHPRGKDGKFITKGGRVNVDAYEGQHRFQGTAEEFHRAADGSTVVDVKSDQGATVRGVPTSHISEAPKAVATLKTAQAPPHANAQTAVEHLDNAQHHLAQANNHLDKAQRTSGANFDAHEAAAKKHRELAQGHRDQARALLAPHAARESGGMTQTKEPPLKYSHTETSGRHEGMAVYKPLGTPSEGHKIPSAPTAPVATPAKRGRPAGTSPLAIRPSTHQGQNGHLVYGRDTHGRKVSVFAPGDREHAEKARANIKAGRGAFEGLTPSHEAAKVPAMETRGPATPVGPSDTHKAETRDEARARIQESMRNSTQKAFAAKPESAAPKYNDGPTGDSTTWSPERRAQHQAKVAQHRQELEDHKAAIRKDMKGVDFGKAAQAAQDRTRAINNANVAKDEAAVKAVGNNTNLAELQSMANSANPTVKAAAERRLHALAAHPDTRTGKAAADILGKVQVYNVNTGKVEHVSQNEATAGHIRYGQSLGAGTPAAGQTIKNALDAHPSTGNLNGYGVNELKALLRSSKSSPADRTRIETELTNRGYAKTANGIWAKGGHRAKRGSQSIGGKKFNDLEAREARSGKA